MKFNIRQVNISAYQIAFILLICRCQSFMISIWLREIIDVNTSNIFISLFISLLGVFIIYIPALILLKKFEYRNIIEITKTIFPKMGNIISVIFSIYFLLMAIAHVASTDFFMVFYIYTDSGPFLIVGILAVVIYALYMGIEAVFRAGAIIFIMFFIFNFILLLILLPTYNINYLGPFVFSDFSSIVKHSSMLTFSAELVAMLVLAEHSKQKTVAAYASFQLILFVMEIFLFLSIILSIGRYANTILFPLYTISSMVEIPVLERSESFYIVLDTMLSVIKTAIYIFLSHRCLRPIIGYKFNKAIIILFGVICFILSIGLFYHIMILKALIEFINLPIVISIFIIFIPIILLIANKLKRS